jgi:hypothetical protein
MSQSQNNKNEDEVKLNIPENSNFISDFFLGFLDSLKVFSTFSIILNNRSISNNIKNCMILNGLLFLGSMIFYVYFVDPLTNFVVQRLSFLGFLLVLGKYFYYCLWLIPVYLVCQVITSLWIDEIYYEGLEIIEKCKHVVEGQDFITNLSNQLERVLFVISFIIFLSFINFFIDIPGVIILKYLTLSILNSIYVFEYILLQKYIRNYKSIMNFIESKFFYFLGYGIILTVLINLINSVTINSSIFLMAFPFFLLSSIQVNKLRFNANSEIKNKKLIFFFLINKFYELGLILLNCLCRTKSKLG